MKANISSSNLVRRQMETFEDAFTLLKPSCLNPVISVNVKKRPGYTTESGGTITSVTRSKSLHTLTQGARGELFEARLNFELSSICISCVPICGEGGNRQIQKMTGGDHRLTCISITLVKGQLVIIKI